MSLLRDLWGDSDGGGGDHSGGGGVRESKGTNQSHRSSTASESSKLPAFSEDDICASVECFFF